MPIALQLVGRRWEDEKVSVSQDHHRLVLTWTIGLASHAFHSREIGSLRCHSKSSTSPLPVTIFTGDRWKCLLPHDYIRVHSCSRGEIHICQYASFAVDLCLHRTTKGQSEIDKKAKAVSFHRVSLAIRPPYIPYHLCMFDRNRGCSCSLSIYDQSLLIGVSISLLSTSR